MQDLKWFTAAEIGVAYAARRLSPVELVQALLAEIAARNAEYGAFIKVDAEGALSAARKAEEEIAAGRSRGPLHGVPVGVKDNIDIAGLATTCHSKILLDNVAREDAAAIKMLRQAGAILLGKQSLHEFAFGGPSQELPFPYARHPWNTDYHRAVRPPAPAPHWPLALCRCRSAPMPAGQSAIRPAIAAWSD